MNFKSISRIFKDCWEYICVFMFYTGISTNSEHNVLLVKFRRAINSQI